MSKNLEKKKQIRQKKNSGILLISGLSERERDGKRKQKNTLEEL